MKLNWVELSWVEWWKRGKTKNGRSYIMKVNVFQMTVIKTFCLLKKKNVFFSGKSDHTWPLQDFYVSMKNKKDLAHSSQRFDLWSCHSTKLFWKPANILLFLFFFFLFHPMTTPCHLIVHVAFSALPAFRNPIPSSSSFSSSVLHIPLFQRSNDWGYLCLGKYLFRVGNIKWYIKCPEKAR